MSAIPSNNKVPGVSKTPAAPPATPGTKNPRALIAVDPLPLDPAQEVMTWGDVLIQAYSDELKGKKAK